MDTNESLEKAESLLKEMTLDEKIILISGIDSMFTAGVPRLGVRRIRMADASMGLRDKDILGTAFPATIALAATWNRGLSRQYGSAVGAEFRAAQIDVLLGPGVNIYRVPQCGRNFEYFGEDPALASALTAAYIQGAQSQGVAATVKHFAANNSDWHRCSSNSVVDDRTLREIYFPAFESAVREGGVLSLMTSYNLLNGEYTAESPKLIREIAMEEWGFDGLVMSDWEGTWSAEKSFQSGLHLEMPGGKLWKTETIRELLAKGVIQESELDRKNRAILHWTFRIEKLQQSAPKGKGRCPAHAGIALEVARKGTVLLKNRDRLLPLKRSPGRIHIVGPCAHPTPTSGGGAAKVDTVNPRSVLGSFMDLAPDLEIIRSENGLESSDAVIVCVGFDDKIEHEGSDRPFELPPEQEALIRRCLQANKNTVVVLFAGGAAGMESWIDECPAVLHAWYPGEYGAQAVAEILLGLKNPCGKLPISIERRWRDSPAHENYLPEGGASYETPNYTSRLRPIFDVRYEEGIFVGYRHYDRHDIAPLFPFGHGLSYTSFAYSDLKLEPAGNGSVDISFHLENTGIWAGEEIAQVYVSDLDASVCRPLRELKEFVPVPLESGEGREVKITLNRRAFSFYDVNQKKWLLEPGEFRIEIASSSRDIRLAGVVSL